MTLLHPLLFAFGVICIGIAAILLPKRRSHTWLILLGMVLMAIAGGGPIITLHPQKHLTVMVDLSPSTRGAAFRDRSALMRRIGELAGNIPVDLRAFSDHVQSLPENPVLPDLDCDQTRYDPPAVDIVLLFSDGRFQLPESGTTTYPVVDPMLIDPPDASVIEMHFDGNLPTATLQNHSGARQLIWSGTSQNNSNGVAAGSSTISGGTAIESQIQARLNSADLWPENDTLSVPAQTPPVLVKWWVGPSAPLTGWTALKPSDLPSDPTEYLQAGIIALSDIAAAEISDTRQQRLAQYVRDLGGTLLIFGGDHAFSAGGYSGSQLDSLSPLASDPPTPTTHWMLLGDSSGSMSESLKGRTRWAAAVDAMLRLLPALPSKDVVSIGSFARDLSWWVDSQSASTAARLAAPPPNVGPNGPTNLQSVLNQIAKRIDPLPCELLLLTDADTTIDDPQSLAAALKTANVRISLLALGSIPPENPVVRIVAATGGHWSANDDPVGWTTSLQKLMRSASPSHLENTKTQLRFDPSVGLPIRPLNLWNRAWIKANATQLATTDDSNQPVTLGARWNVGVGTAAAFGFTPTIDEADTLAKQLASPPRDPRFKVTWKCNAAINVSVDTSNDIGYLNGLQFELNLADDPPLPLRQTGPGRYSLEIPAIRAPSLSTLQLNGHVIDRRAIPGRYAPEFEAIGNDDSALAQLAARTGGKVIAPTQHAPIAFAWPLQHVRLDSYFAIAGAIAFATGIIFSRSAQPERRAHF